MIKQGENVKLVRKENNRIEHYLVQYMNRTLPIVFDTDRQNVVTVLPQEKKPEVEWRHL